MAHRGAQARGIEAVPRGTRLTDVFVDSSAVIAIAFNELAAAGAQRKLRSAGRVQAAPLLEAEVRAACQHEGRPHDNQLLAAIEWIHPDRPLSAEIAIVLEAGYVRGADCWHLATALFAAPDPRNATFLTLDVRQRVVAKALGFRV